MDFGVTSLTLSYFPPKALILSLQVKLSSVPSTADNSDITVPSVQFLSTAMLAWLMQGPSECLYSNKVSKNSSTSIVQDCSYPGKSELDATLLSLTIL